MTNLVASDFRTAIGSRIEASQHLLASQWLDELKQLVPVAPADILPGDQLLQGDGAWRDRTKRTQILATAERNVTRMNETLGKLVALSRSRSGTESALVQRQGRYSRRVDARRRHHILP